MFNAERPIYLFLNLYSAFSIVKTRAQSALHWNKLYIKIVFKNIKKHDYTSILNSQCQVDRHKKKSMLHNEIKIRVTNYHIHRFKWPSLNKLS